MNSYTVCFANYTIGADAYENVADPVSYTHLDVYKRQM